MSKKISMKAIIVEHLRNLPNGKSLTVEAAASAADAILETTREKLTTQSGEVTIGSVGKLFSKHYPAATRYSPSAAQHVRREAYKTVRFKAFKAAKAKL